MELSYGKVAGVDSLRSMCDVAAFTFLGKPVAASGDSPVCLHGHKSQHQLELAESLERHLHHHQPPGSP
eukprot:608945-Amphidinium_carterae.1